MKVYGASTDDIRRVVAQVSGEHYDGNVEIKSLEDRSNSAGPRATFTLRVVHGAAGRPGAIGKPLRTGTGPHGMRRCVSACWHVHWDVIEELLRQYPHARVVSGIQLRGRHVVYTADTFRDTALLTAHLNVANWYEPMSMPQCCECDHTRYTDTPATVNPARTGQLVPHGVAMSPVRAEDRDEHTRTKATPGDPYPYDPADDAAEVARAQQEVARHQASNLFSPARGVAYLDGLQAAQPWSKYGSATVDRTLADIDKVLDD
jgi:hypothetical protein